MTDTLTGRGFFHLRVYENGKLIQEINEENLIVTSGRGCVAHLLGGDTSATFFVNKIGFGENGGAAAPADTSLGGTTFVKAIGSVSYPNPTAVKFDFQLTTAEGNGIGIREFGLITGNNTLFARKQRDIINKTASISLLGAWTIQY